MFTFPSNNNLSSLKIVAHRGSPNYLPENTLESFAVAMYSGADFIELDIQLTKDNHIIVFHDPYLSRVTDIEKFPEFKDRRRVRDYKGQPLNDFFTIDFTLEELKKLSIFQKINPKRVNVFDGRFHIPTLTEVLEFVIQENSRKKSLEEDYEAIGVFLEVKDGDFYRNSSIDIGSNLLSLLQSLNLSTQAECKQVCPLTIISFDKTTLKFFSSQTDLELDQLVSKEEEFSFDEISKYAQIVGPAYSLLFRGETVKEQSSFTIEAREKGLKIFPWTLKDDDLKLKASSEEIHKALFLYGLVDGITTDFPEKAKAILELLKNEFALQKEDEKMKINFH